MTLVLGFHFSCSLDQLGCLRWMTFLVLSVPSQVRRASDGVFFESLLCLLDGLRVRWDSSWILVESRGNLWTFLLCWSSQGSAYCEGGTEIGEAGGDGRLVSPT